MPYKDPEKRREYMRLYMRESRQVNKPVVKPILTPEWQFTRIKTAKDILTLLERTLNEVMQSNTDVLSKARTVAYVAATTLKAIEITDLEERIAALEEQIGMRQAN